MLRTLHWHHSGISRGQYLIGLQRTYWKDAKEKQTYKSKYQNYGIVTPLSLPLWTGQEAGKPFFLSLWQEEDPGPEWTNAIRRMLTCDGVNKARDCSKPCCSPPHYNSLYLLSEWTADLEQTHSITMYNKLVKVTTRGFQIGELPRKTLLHYRLYYIYCGKISRYLDGIKSKILLLQWRLTSSDVGRWNLGVQFSMLRVGQSLELLVSLGWSVGQDNVR